MVESIGLIGVPSSMGAFAPGQERAPQALREAGLVHRLTQAGVATELHLYPGTFHGSSGVFPQAAISQRIDADYIAAIRRALTS